MYKLYYTPGACSMAIHVALNECNAEFTLEKVDMQAGQNRTPEFLKINPRGQIPVLIDDGRAIREGAAMLIHILEKHNNALLPKNDPERASALEWMMFCNATLHPAYARVFFLLKNPADQAAKEPLLDAAIANINKLWEEVEERLSVSPYLAGEQATIADILLTVIANWSARMPKPITLGAKTKQLLRTIIARPAYAKALATESVEYKVAA